MSNKSVYSRQLHQHIDEFVVQEKLPPEYKSLALLWFTPLIDKIIVHQLNAKRNIVVAINGCQGSGKSTLTGLLVSIINALYPVKAIGFSIDDFYYSKDQRKTLSKTVHPLLSTRGVPGTHDIKLLDSVLNDLKSNKPCAIPIFDKASDDLLPQSEWTQINNKVDITILEGWCVGIQAQHSSQLEEPVNSFEKREDKDGKWREYVNYKLANEYQEVFSHIDYLIMMKASSFEQVFDWRWEQEQRLSQLKHMSNTSNTSLMDKQQVQQFIQYYQRLTEHALKTLPDRCDTVFTLNKTRGIEKCFHR